MPALRLQVLEPRDGQVTYKSWDERSDIGNLGLMDDDEQPLPANVMYPGTSIYWDKDQLKGE
jgi:ATP-dependent Clp protease protease subunit